jgi:hypothetical protein
MIARDQHWQRAVCAVKSCVTVHQQRKRKSNEYTLNECCNMFLILAACDNRVNVASRVCAERYLACHLLNANVIRRLDQGIRESGNVIPTPSLDRSRTQRTLPLEEIVLVAQYPRSSTRGIARQLGMDHCAVHLVLLYLYHYTQVQGLIPHDRLPRLQYCERFVREHERDPSFVD